MTRETRYAYRASDFGDSLPDDPWAATQTLTRLTVTLMRDARPVELRLDDGALAMPAVLGQQVHPAGQPVHRLWELTDEGKGTRIVAYRLEAPEDTGTPCTVLTTALPLTPGQNYALSRRLPDGSDDILQAGGLASGTRVLTQSGKRAVEEIAPGEGVWTEGGGFEPVLWHGVQTLTARGVGAPVQLRRGYLGLTGDLRVAHGQLIRVAGGAGPVLVPAAALAEAGLAERDFGMSVTWHQLLLPSHALIQAEGLAVASLFAPDRVAGGLPGGWPEPLEMPRAPVLPRLGMEDAVALLG